MFIRKKNLCSIDDNNVNIFVIENDVENVINKIFLVAGILYNVADDF